MNKITKTIAYTIVACGAVLGLGDRAALTQSGYYYLQARHSGQCLNVFNSGQNNGDNVVQGEECNTSNFEWLITPAGGGYSYLQARHSGQCLNVYNGGQNNGDNVVQGEECKSSNFQWGIVPVSNVRSSGSDYERWRNDSESDYERWRNRNSSWQERDLRRGEPAGEIQTLPNLQKR